MNGELKETFQGFKPNYKEFLYRMVNDLWESYIYNVYIPWGDPDLQEETVEKIDIETVGHFREWCYNSGFYAIDDYLPQSDSQLRAIIEQCREIVDY
jgi:hypothetical protein